MVTERYTNDNSLPPTDILDSINESSRLKRQDNLSGTQRYKLSSFEGYDNISSQQSHSFCKEHSSYNNDSSFMRKFSTSIDFKLNK